MPLEGTATRSKAPLEVVLGAMGSQARQVLEAALALPKEERAELAAKILASVDGDDTTDPDVEAAWAEEITRRAEQALSGESKGSPWKAVQEEARDMLGRK